jgi:hypothetical protein
VAVFFQRYNDYLCRTYLPRADGMLTVCKSIADEYRANYGVVSEVLMNAPPFCDLPRYLNQYDVGLYLLPPTNFNYQLALPNKLFEFVQARLAVAIGPSLEMARLVREYDCGIVSDEFSPESLARRLNELDREHIDHFKQRSHFAARELCFEKNSEVLLGMINRLMGSG